MRQTRTFHPQVEVEYDGETVLVDAGMVDELRELWALGARTRYSCQGGPECSKYIVFLEPHGKLKPEVWEEVRGWVKRVKVIGNRFVVYAKAPWER